MACEEDKIPVAPLATITLVGTNVCLVTAFGVAALLGMAERAQEVKTGATLESPYAASMAEQQAAVTNGAEGGMSVDRAIDRVLRNAETK
jgi:hypothetical protein